MSDLSPSKLILLLLVALLLFGARRLPEIGRSLGTGLREFKSSVNGDEPASVAAGPDKIQELGRSLGGEVRSVKETVSGAIEPDRTLGQSPTS